MLTTTDAAARLGLTPGRVRQLIRAGQLPAVKAGRDWLIEKTDLKLVETRRRRGRPRKERVMRADEILSWVDLKQGAASRSKIRECFFAANDEGTIQATEMLKLFPGQPALHTTTSLRTALIAAGCEEA